MSSYLLLGPEAGAKADEVKRIRSELAAKYGDGLEFERFYPFDGEQGELFASLANDSLFSDHRLILISQLESAGAAFLNELAGYLANPSPSATVVLASSETSITKKIMDAIPKERTRIFYDLLEGEKSAWIRTHFRRLGLTITSEAVELLIAMTEDNTQELRTVCNQLALFWQHDSPTKPIDEEAVQTYLHHSRVEDAFTLFPTLPPAISKKPSPVFTPCWAAVITRLPFCSSAACCGNLDVCFRSPKALKRARMNPRCFQTPMSF